MTRNIIQFVILFFLLVLAQAICSKICLFNVAVPIIFIYFIIRLPLSLGVNWLMTLSFFIGLVIDIFNNSLGMNALSCVILAISKRPVFRLYFPREDEYNPTVRSSLSASHRSLPMNTQSHHAEVPDNCYPRQYKDCGVPHVRSAQTHAACLWSALHTAKSLRRPDKHEHIWHARSPEMSVCLFRVQS